MHLPPDTTSPLRGLVELVATWRARYDTAFMLPPEWRGTEPAGPAATWRAWCQAGIGDGRTPLLAPWSMPQVQQRFTMTRVPEPAGPWVDGLMCDLDGTARLQAAGGRWAGLWLRVRIKACEMAWWRARAADAPWDAGYLHDTPSVRERLGVFVPRRPTLLVARSPDPAFLSRCVRTLSVRQAVFRHPVRLLVLGGPPAFLSTRVSG